MLGQFKLGSECFDFSEKIAHGANIARYSVRVNARNNVSAAHAAAWQSSAMRSGWFERLIAAIDDDERSYSKLAEDAGLGRNFVQQMIKNGKEPGAEKLSKLLNAMKPGVSIYVLTGLEVTAQDVEFLQLLRSLPSETRQDAIRFLKGVATREDAR